MTDPLQNPQTGHGIECLCDVCIQNYLVSKGEVIYRGYHDGSVTCRWEQRLDYPGRNVVCEQGHDAAGAAKTVYECAVNAGFLEPKGPCVIKRVMSDGISTKDGLS
jgi:hypothetical protein